MRQYRGGRARRAAGRPLPSDGTSQRGQALPFFAVLLAGLIMAAALVIDGGGTLVRFRQLQNAADAGATAASHQFGTTGCAAGAGPRGVVVSTARTAVRANIPGFPNSRIVVSCPGGYGNFAVRVTLRDTGQATFMRLMNPSGLDMSTSATAINRPSGGAVNYAVMALNPGRPTWLLNRGCPALLVEGSARLDAFASVHVNSSCRMANGGAALTIGSASMVVRSGQLTVVGDAAGAFTPAPLTRQQPRSDPYAGLRAPAAGRLPVRSNARLAIGGTQVLEPGIYRGGLDVAGTALLLPGFYYIERGGILVRGTGAMYSVNAGVTSTDGSSWASDCTPIQCGVVIYNAGGSQMGPLDFMGGSSVRLRGYSPAADRLGLGLYELSNVMIWQDAQPLPSGTRVQPSLVLAGNPQLDLYGVVYLPSAKVSVVGASDFSLAASLVVWEMEVIGSGNMVLRYDPTAFPQQFDYGLVE